MIVKNLYSLNVWRKIITVFALHKSVKFESSVLITILNIILLTLLPLAFNFYLNHVHIKILQPELKFYEYIVNANMITLKN